MTLEVWTIGHSTRAVEQFVDALGSCNIQRLVDIRRFPHSRRHPAYNSDELKRAVFAAAVKYEWLGDELGGFRDPKKHSPHVSLKDAFQGYADHLASPMFRRGETKLLDWADRERVAYMCSERQPKDCHRKILSDHLALTRGAVVRHILDPDHVEPHEVTRAARLVAGKVVYAPPSLDAFTGACGPGPS